MLRGVVVVTMERPVDSVPEQPEHRRDQGQHRQDRDNHDQHRAETELRKIVVGIMNRPSSAKTTVNPEKRTALLAVLPEISIASVLDGHACVPHDTARR